jgi:alkylation response protein AidB-like acyl-CoA dehydrogenase
VTTTTFDVSTIASLGADIRARADATEQGRRLDGVVLQKLRDVRAFDLTLPQSMGGFEVDILTMARAIEEAAVHDGSTGWCVGIGNGTAVLSAYLEPAAARELFGPGRIAGGAFAPNGRLREEGDGFRLNGRWQFASGSQHCSVIVGSAFVMDGDEQRTVDGAPDWRIAMMPAADVQILDTWHVAGLRGTGSQDIVAEDIFVPLSHTMRAGASRPFEDGPLYRFPMFGLLSLTISPVPLGVARRAIDEFVALAAAKTPLGARAKLADQSIAQQQVAMAEAELQSGRAWMYEVTQEIWENVVAGGRASIEDRARLRAACAHACTVAVRAVDTVYRLGGGSALYETSVLQRCLRDVHAATQHVQLNHGNYTLLGQTMFGQRPQTMAL